MGKYYLGRTSLKRLEGVHPDLVRVVKRAIEISKVDFGITEGARSMATQQQYLKEGKTTTLASLHLPQEDGYSWAVDVYTLDEQGKATWEHKYFRWVIQAMFTAAIELGVQIEAGGLWRDFLDSPHIQLNPKYY